MEKHLFAIGYLASQIMQRNVKNYDLIKLVYIAGCLHDIGKIVPSVQKELLKKSPNFKNKSNLNETSALLYHLMNDNSYKKINKANKKAIEHIIYYQDIIPYRKKELNTFGKIYDKCKKFNLEKITLDFNLLIDKINKIGKIYFKKVSETSIKVEGFLKNSIDTSYIYKEKVPLYKEYQKDYLNSINSNAFNNLSRMAVILANQKISSLTSKQLEQHLNKGTLSSLEHNQENYIKNNYIKNNYIKKYLKDFKNIKQIEDISILSGYGEKTITALNWASKGKKIIWICPRVQVCKNLVNDLIIKLKDIKIEIHTGEFKNIYQSGCIYSSEDNYFSGDIIITTIDQIINFITVYQKTIFLDIFMKSYVIFDDFHEYINTSLFNFLFAELIECKKIKNDNSVLLISTTPHPVFTKEILNIDNIVTINSSNKSKYILLFEDYDETVLDESNPFYSLQPDNTFVISNTAITAQQSFILNQNKEDAIVFHSKFKHSDKQKIYNNIIKYFGKKRKNRNMVLRTGPIIQSSLNVTCDKMITEKTIAENWLQRLKHLDPFEKNKENLYITAIPNNKKSKSSWLLSKNNCYQSSKAWINYLKTHNKLNFIINDFYQLYIDFYQKNYNIIKKDMIKNLEKSKEEINEKLSKPLYSNKYKGIEFKIKNRSLRGNQRFIQMAKCHINNIFTNLNEYAVETFTDYLMESVSFIPEELITFMKQKHYCIKKEINKYVNPLIAAKDFYSPIYLSYTSSDLEKLNSKPHQYSIYYVKGNKQIIGYINKQLIENLIKILSIKKP